MSETRTCWCRAGSTPHTYGQGPFCGNGYEPPTPIDWPARFRAAADAAEAAEFPGTARDLHGLAEQVRSLAISWPHVVEDIGRALLGEAS